MTETAYPVTTITGHDYPLSHLQHGAPVLEHYRHDPSTADGSKDDDGQISCICGYFDDDGWTVQCDKCMRWQHQLCYYPDYEDRSLPESLQHYCVDCHPRSHDRDGARIRQKIRREDQISEVNGVKRQAPKSHKKKVKEPSYTNGWPLDKSRHDRNSASPRDQPPPAKRPKTSHRPSDSITAKGHSRKRNVSNANHRRSLSESPDRPSELYSDHFVQCYQHDAWDEIAVNLHNSIGVSSALSDWLNASEEAFRDIHGHAKTEALNRWDGQLDDIPGKAQIEIRSAQDDRVTDSEGNYPFWKWVTVQESVASGAYIGELKGHVGFKEEYMQDLANRWSLLRHPEPFVFFHPTLPIYIDARNEGTELRYVRRSCLPNARLQILVTNSTDYRFCFMATQQIDPGMEVSVPWDTSHGIPELQPKLQSGLADGDLDRMCSWVSKALANCGPCACQLPEHECMMTRLDRRGAGSKFDELPQSAKAPKSKRKKLGQHPPPLNTLVNSRSGSEARRGEPDDDPSDSRSPSGSASASRDMTPNYHHTHNGSLSAIPELSERERKKLAKEEEMFKKQEEEQTGKSGKKKRNSGGSNLSTPNATASKQLGFPGPSKYADASTSRQSGLASAKPGRRPKGSVSHRSSLTSAPRGTKRPKPLYTDSGVQCDIEGEEEARLKAITPPRRPFLSTTQRLLQRCALNNARRKGPAAVAEVERRNSEASNKMDVDESPQNRTFPKMDLPTLNALPTPTEPPLEQIWSNDAEMDDVNESEKDSSLATLDPGKASEDASTSAIPSIPSLSSQSPADASATLLPSQAMHPASEANEPPTHAHKPVNMHVQMPPPPLNPFAASSLAVSSDTPNSVTAFVQSPLSTAGTGPIFSPAVNAAVTPSPAKKKMSLSDYTKRAKAKDKDPEAKTDRESSPASNADGVVVPPLQASSSEVLKDGESNSAVEDDVKMEDVPESSSTILQT